MEPAPEPNLFFRWTNKPARWELLPICDKIRIYARQHLDHRYSPYVDKITAKELVRHVLGSEFDDKIKVAEILQIVEAGSNIDPSLICTPPRAIFKASHGSNMNKILDASVSAKVVRSLMSAWNAPYSAKHQRQYAHIKPRFFAEELVNGGSVWSVMVRCVFGVPVCVGVSHSSLSPGLQNSYTTQWELIDKPKRDEIPEPKTLPLMLAASERLSARFEFVRVDFMVPDLDAGPVYFGEWTFSPAAGTRVYSPEVELKLGRLWSR